MKNYPHLKGHITDLLIGDLFKDEVDEVLEPMARLKAERLAQPVVATLAE